MSIYDHLEFRHFKYIVAIAEAGTFTAAAARLPLAQSALSRQISEMEDALGVHIFDRSRGGTTPKTHRVYAWMHDTGDPAKPKRHVTVLHIPPVVSPQTAVKAAIVQEYKDRAKAN